ncbi:MAG: hypothetical protein RQ751_01025 [Longimicrobiales bacterium]|nr:hypothetical protein [Longimicrobiales bacterium]
MSEKPSRLRLPHPLVLMSGCVFAAAALTWIVPAGAFDRQLDEETGRMVAVAGSYQPVDAEPVGPVDALVAIPRGITEVGDIIALIFLIGGALTVIDRTGALERGVGWVVRALGGQGALVLPLVCVVFATGGVLFNMAEEIVALVPILLVLTHRLGYPPVVAAMVSVGPAALGSAFSPMNPFQVLIAQNVADLPPGSGSGFRTLFLMLALAAWIALTLRVAARSRSGSAAVEHADAPLKPTDIAILAALLGTFAWLGWGILMQDWDFLQMAGPFFGLGILAGLLGGLGTARTADAFVAGFRDMTFAGVLIGMARAIVLVMQDGSVVDTLVRALFIPLEGLPTLVSAVGMIAAQALVHIPVSSVSGQAVLTMPIVAPLADLLGMSRQVAVLAYQYGAGLMDMITPTNGALMAVLAAAGVRYEEWFSVAVRAWLLLMAIGAVSVGAALAIGLS